MNAKEQAQLFIIVGFAVGHGCDVDVNELLQLLEQKKSQLLRDKLLMVIDFAKDQGIQKFLSNADIRMLESAVKFEL